MLSPGAWYKKVPKGLRENLLFRRRLLDLCERDETAQAAVRLACKEDILFWINAFVWQFNPQHVGNEIGPFITWPFQDVALLGNGRDGYADGRKYGILETIEDRKDMVIEKSREMGATWLCLLAMDWLGQFHGWKKFLLISRSADAVDCKDADSLFWKLDFIHENLPGWLCRNIERTSMFLGFPNGSSITGQASTGRAGVGGRSTAMFVDEFSQIKEDFEVFHRTADTTRSRIFNFTHTGLDTCAYELTNRYEVRKLRLHWSEHPEKNHGLYQYDPEAGKVDVKDKSFHYPVGFQFVMDGKLRSPWYDAECLRRGSARAIAMDLDIDPKGSVSQFFDPLMIAGLKRTYCCAPYWEGELHYDKDTARPIELVAVKGGHLRLWTHLGANNLPANKTITIGADISAGTGATPSCLSFFNPETGEKIGSYTNAFIRPFDLAALAVAFCWLFKGKNNDGALFAWEMQGPGVIFGKQVMDLGYRNVYFRRNEHELKANVSDTPGWFPSNDNKRSLLEEYRAGLSTHRFINREEEALEECLAFKYTTKGTVEHGGEASVNDPTGARVNHGDHVIADALAYKMGISLGKYQVQDITAEIVVGTLAWRRGLADNARRLEEAWI